MTNQLPRLARALDQAVAEGAFPGAQCVVSLADRVVHHSWHGRRWLGPGARPVGPQTRFDLASLTKALSTTLLLLDRAVGGRARLDESLATQWAPARGSKVGTLQLEDLLRHRAGLPAWGPLYQQAVANPVAPIDLAVRRRRFEQMVALLLASSRQAPAGRKALYSDLGFMLLGAWLAPAGADELARCFADTLAAPLKLGLIGFVPVGTARAARWPCAATEHSPWHGRLLLREVHDENAWAMGGAAGHAGLFGTAVAVDHVGRALLRAHRGHSRRWPAEWIARFAERDHTVPDSTRAIGFDTPSPGASQAGTRFGPRSIGHLGFTGCSWWLDLDAGVGITLLTNRVHPSRNNQQIRTVRPALHDLAWEELGAAGA